MKFLLLGVIALVTGLMAPVWAAPAATMPSSMCPFTDQGLAALSLTPEQAAVAHRIAGDVQRGMVVRDPVREMWPELFLGMTPKTLTLDQAIAANRARLVDLLSKPHPSTSEIQSLAREIAVQELTLKELVDSGVIALSSILTPVQRARLQECPLLAQMPR